MLDSKFETQHQTYHPKSKAVYSDRSITLCAEPFHHCIYHVQIYLFQLTFAVTALAGAICQLIRAIVGATVGICLPEKGGMIVFAALDNAKYISHIGSLQRSGVSS